MTLSAAVEGGVSVSCVTADGTATEADNDYTATSDALQFTGTADETQQFVVSTVGDRKVKADETLAVALSYVWKDDALEDVVQGLLKKVTCSSPTLPGNRWTST